MDWKDRAAQLKISESKSWNEVYSTIRSEYGSQYNDERIRGAVRRHPLYNQKDKKQVDIKLELVKALERENNIKDLSNKLKASERVIIAYIDDLKEEGYNVIEADGTYMIYKNIIPQENRHTEKWSGDKIVKVGLMGDTQFNSKYVQITYLNKFYDICESEGIKTVYHTGDIDDGEEMRMGHKYECYTQGADDHIKEIVKNYPYRKGITTKFITGNHDHSMIKRCGLDIGNQIAEKREDMIYLGQSDALINLTPNCTLELRHPIDGTAYAISYKIQKMIEAMSGGEKPNILAVGHYHKAEYLFYRNVHAIQTGCFQAQTSWERGKQISIMLGGWIIEAHVNSEGHITRFKQEFIPFYTAVKDDYLNYQR